MTIFGSTQFLERQQFFNGERLFASDLQTLESFNREMRWLHNQSLHKPGVGNGYGVSGNKGDRMVTIQPGYALDACGREIVLTVQHVEPVPPVANDGNGGSVYYDLTVSYRTDADLVESETRQGICSQAGAVALREAPNFCWIQLGANLQPLDAQLKVEVQSNMRIVLARAEVRNCQLYQPLSVAQRRDARQHTQPRIECGGATGGWSTLSVMNSQTGGQMVIGLGTHVDTTSGQFQMPPAYSAHVVGDREFTSQEAMTFAAVQNPFVLDGYVNIMNPTADGFDLQMFIPDLTDETDGVVNPPGFLSSFQEDAVEGIKILGANNWNVVWMGVES